MRAFGRIGFVAILAGAVFAQSSEAPPSFEAADVHVSLRSKNPSMRGGFYRGGRFELHSATMADLIRTAWGLDDNDKVAQSVDVFAMLIQHGTLMQTHAACAKAMRVTAANMVGPRIAYAVDGDRPTDALQTP